MFDLHNKFLVRNLHLSYCIYINGGGLRTETEKSLFLSRPSCSVNILIQDFTLVMLTLIS